MNALWESHAIHAKKVGELHHCVEAMLQYYDVTLNLELCPWFTRCLIVKLL